MIYGRKNSVIIVLASVVVLMSGAIGYLVLTRQHTSILAPVSDNILKTEETKVPESTPNNESITTATPTSSEPLFVFDVATMTSSGKGSYPCSGDATEKGDQQYAMNLNKDQQTAIKNFYGYLVKKDYNQAILTINNDTENNYGILFKTLFPICSAAHLPLAMTTQRDGIAMLVLADSGSPVYSFGFLALSDNKIVLYKSKINNYSNNNSDKSSEAEMEKEFKAGAFSNNDLQNEYDQFVSQF